MLTGLTRGISEAMQRAWGGRETQSDKEDISQV